MFWRARGLREITNQLPESGDERVSSGGSKKAGYIPSVPEFHFRRSRLQLRANLLIRQHGESACG